MDFRKKIYSLAFLIATFAALPLPADDKLPSLATDSKISTGRLDNGITYYLVTNSGQQGIVDMTLVQKAGIADEGKDKKGESIVMSRGALAELPKFNDPQPFVYLQRMGVFPGERGYVHVSDDATIYNFPNFMVSQTTEAVDSTLLMIFDIIESQSSRSDRYAPGNQAIIIAGDIDASSLVTKMNMLSMMVSKRSAQPRERTYSWVANDTLRFRFGRRHDGAASRISFRYSMPRLPEESMGSVQSLVTERLVRELGVLIRKRLSAELRSQGIAYTGLECIYHNGTEGPSDESFSVSLTVDKTNLAETAAAVGGVLAGIDARGIDADEYKDIRSETGMDWYYVHSEFPNSFYVDRCVAAFLYGYSLASPLTEKEFFTKKNVADSTNAALLTRYASALLDRERNLSIDCRVERSDSLKNAVIEAFYAAWSAGSTLHKAHNADTLALGSHKKAVKLKSENSEPMTGGKLWTFSNGMQVIFKETDDDGVFRYNFLLRSGYARAKGLKDGEFAYLDDVVGVCDIAGMSGYDFAEAMAANGIELKTKTDVSDVSVSGSAPSSRIMLVLKALLSIAYDSKPNATDFEFYRQCKRLSLDMDEDMLTSRQMLVDSLLAPGYEFLPVRKGSELSDDFPSRADDFFDSVFSKCNDGVLILIGDLDEGSLKKLLCQYLGAFKTDNSSPFRAKTSYKAPTGTRSKKTKGGRSLIDLAFSVPFNYTAENFMTANVASIAMYRAVASAAASAGWYGSWNSEFVMFPDERMNLYFHLGMSDKNGLPASMIQGSSAENVVRRVDNAIASLSHSGISEQQLSTYVSLYGNSLKARMSESDTIEEMLVLRYSYGKDLMTNYETRLKAVTRDKVNEFLAQIDQGCVARYIIEGPQEEEFIREPAVEEIPYVMPDTLHVGAGADPTGMAKLYWRLFRGMYQDEADERIDVTKLWVPDPMPERKPEMKEETEAPEDNEAEIGEPAEEVEPSESYVETTEEEPGLIEEGVLPLPR